MATSCVRTDRQTGRLSNSLSVCFPCISKRCVLSTVRSLMLVRIVICVFDQRAGERKLRANIYVFYQSTPLSYLNSLMLTLTHARSLGQVFGPPTDYTSTVLLTIRMHACMHACTTQPRCVNLPFSQPE